MEMRRRFLLTMIALAVGLFAGGVAYATDDPDDGFNRPERLRLLDKADKFEFVDVGAQGQSPGDLFIFENQLRNRADTRTHGRFLSSCVVLVTPGLVSCRGTLELQQGTIEVATAIDLAAGGEIRAAVTGGTRDYRRAHGQMRLSEEVSPGVREMTVELLP